MTNEYLAVELCEQFFNGIDENTFRRNKKKTYIPQLEAMGYKVTEIKNGRGRHTIYILEEVGKTEQQKANEEFLEILNCDDIGDKNIELMKFILKAILKKELVPAHEELANAARHDGIQNVKSKTTISNYIGFFKENGVIIDPIEIPVWVDDEIGNREYDEETGEIYPTYYKNVVNKLYYDYADEGVGGHRKRLKPRTQEAIDTAFKTMYREEFQKIIVPMIKKKIDRSIIKEAKSFLQSRVLKEIGKAYGLNRCTVIEEPIINPCMQNELKSYFGLNKQDQFGMNIEIDTSHIKVVDVKRQVGTKPTEIEAMMEYHLLLKSHAQLYKNSEYAMPLHIYNKWHKGKAFEDTVHELSVPIVKQDVIIPQDDILQSYTKNKQVNEIALQQCESQYTNEGTPTFDKDLAAFKFKPQSDVTTNDMKNIMLKGMMNKQRGVMQYDDRTND
ncbi:hypothetical protein OB968_02730 [Bacillus cereus]|nr:hypothetical protein [Bacillus cereus]